jgi:hypothetical protein
MGKASRRKKRDRDFAETPIRVISQETGEVIEEFYAPKVARFFNDKMKSGEFKTKEDATAWVVKALEHMTEERKKTAPHDGDTQHA